VKPVLTREQMRAFDRDAIEAGRVPSLVLMENAGRGATEVLVQMLAGTPGGVARARVVVVCGSGNNGGDGLVVARRLLTLGSRPRVVLCASRQRLKGDALANADAYLGLGGNLVEATDEGALAPVDQELDAADLIVDALLGTGLDRDVSGLLAAVIHRINEAAAPVVALDIPSGLDANTGSVLGVAVRCAATVTFAQLKCGLLSTVAAAHAGRLHVVDIGVPPERVERVGSRAWLVEESDVRRWLAPRPLTAHKGSAGRVVAFAGSLGKTGAALLVSRGALRAGAGLVTIAALPVVADVIEARVLEEMTARLDPENEGQSLDRVLANVAAVAIGPGLGLDAWARRVVERVVLQHDGPVVVDADALTLFADRATQLATAAGPRLLTPHPGEMARLLGTDVDAIERDRFAAVERSCELTGAVVLLKGPHTIVGTPDLPPVVVSSAAPALATGGAGDVLTGICSAMACHLPLREAAIVGAYLHGRAAVSWMEAGSDRGLLAREIAERIPAEVAALHRALPPA
jgi:hydroxyethylthiazole kinase-like uncharacterized protein yjeF